MQRSLRLTTLGWNIGGRILFTQSWNVNKKLVNYYCKDEKLNLNINDNAVKQLKSILKEPQFLRVLIEGGGCSGFQYKFEIDAEFDSDEDMTFEKDGVKLVSDIESVKILNGATIDYHKDLIRSGFRVIDIQQAEKGCSCGVSFSIKL